MILEELKSYKPYSISPGYNLQNIIYGKHNDNEIIDGTTYPVDDQTYKAIEGIVHSHIEEDTVSILDYKNSFLLCLHSHHEVSYLEYDLYNHRIMLACIDTFSIYRLLFVFVNYAYNQYHLEQYKALYETWRSLDMSQHLYASQWDAHEYKAVQYIACELINLLKDIMNQRDSFLSLHYDSIEELLTHQHLSFQNHTLAKTFLFQIPQDYQLINIDEEKRIVENIVQKRHTQILDIQPLYTKEEINQLPLFLQESIQDNQNLYLQNREFLDQNDFDLIKSLYRGKTWTCLYYGPSGTGKTTKILSVAGALGLPTMKIVGSRSLDEATLFGKYVLRNGETVFEYGPMTLMMKYGGMFVFDEINMVDSDIISSLNDVLDGTRQKILDNGEIIHAHRNFRFAESMNIGYAGTNEMNISHMSRIQNKIKISKLSIKKMTQIIVKESGIDEMIAHKMASLLDSFNNVIMNLGNETTQRIDLRTLIHWAHKTVDLDGDVIRASLVTIISDLAQEDDDIVNLEDIHQIMSTDGGAGAIMNQIVHTFSQG